MSTGGFSIFSAVGVSIEQYSVFYEFANGSRVRSHLGKTVLRELTHLPIVIDTFLLQI